MSVIISAIICTRNRASDLRDALESLANQDPPSEPCEIVVVDNGSIDATPKVVSEFAPPSWLSVRYVYEGTAGLSRARNAGIAAAQGEIIAFLDDDVIVDKMWITSHLEAYQRDPGIACVGGKILALWLDKQPYWFGPEFYMMLGIASFGDKPCTLEYPAKPIGCNMSIRKAVLTKLGGFCSGLGRKEGNLLSNEEVELFYRLSKMGYKMVYSPDAVVHHKIYPYRATRRYLLSRFYWQGISDALTEQLIKPSSRPLHISNGLRAVLDCRRPLAATVMYQLKRNPQKVMVSMTRLWYLLGKARQELALGIGRAKVLEKTHLSSA